MHTVHKTPLVTVSQRVTRTTSLSELDSRYPELERIQ